MANIIKPKRSESTGQTPTLSPGELAVNIADKKVWVADSSGTPVLIVDGNASITETDPVFSASAAFSITTTDVTNWNMAYGWGDHSAAGYLTTETDPVFNASTAASITSTDTGNWNTAYGWGDHSAAGYLTTENDPTFTASAAYSITTTDIGNWNTAYGWGDHSAAGYLTTETDPVFSASTAASITATDISNWNAKPDTVTVTSTGSTITVTDNTVGGAISFNVETPQGIATTDSVTFAGLTAAGLVYPAADGTSGQVIVTDGAGNLSFATVSVSVALDDLTDVTITTVSNNDLLKYNSTSSQWENVAVSTDDINEGTTNLYFTDARARAAISAGTGISYNSTTGEISATGGGGTPGGSSGQLQWNNAGSLDGVGESEYSTTSPIVLKLNQTANNRTPLVLTINASPSADIFYWADSALNTKGGIDSNGNLYFRYGQGISFLDSSSSSIVLTAPSSASNYTLALPAGLGTSGQVLKLSSGGQLAFGDSVANLSGGTGGSIPYQSGASTTAMLANGTSGQILKANGGTSAPSWVAQSTLAAGSATNIASGGAGQLPYNTGSGATSFLAAGTAGTILRSNNTSAPSWEVQGLFHGGRLTLTTATPITTTDVTSATTIYYTPYTGDKISLYSGTSWATYQFSELSLALGTLTSGKNYDVFVYNNAGTLTLETAVWTNDTTRATSLTLTNGIYLKTGALTRRYLGTFRTTSTTTTEDSITKRFVWNFNNRVEKPLYKNGTTSHTYTTASWRNWNNDATLRIEFILGIDAAQVIHFGGAATGTGIDIGAGFDGGTPGYDSVNSTGTGVSQVRGGRAYSSRGTFLGYHYCQMHEYGASGTTFLDARLEGTIWC